MIRTLEHGFAGKDMVGALGAKVGPSWRVSHGNNPGHGSAGKDMVGALGAEVDRLESEIKRVMPGIRHIDLARTLPSSDFVTLSLGYAVCTAAAQVVAARFAAAAQASQQAMRGPPALAVLAAAVGRRSQLSSHAGMPGEQHLHECPLIIIPECKLQHAGVQETDRGRHDKKTLKERSLYSVDADPELASCQNTN